VKSRGLDIAERPLPLQIDLLGCEASDRLGGHSRNEGLGIHDLFGPNNGPRRNKRVLANLRTIEHDRADPDQRAIADATAMHDRAMADRDLITEEGRVAALGHMQRRLVLNIRSFADANMMNIATQDRAVKNARIEPDLDIPDNDGTGRDPNALMKTRNEFVKGAHDRAGISVPAPIRHHESIEGIAAFVADRIEEDRLDVALTEVTDDRDDRLARILRSIPKLDRGANVCPGRDAA